MRGTKQKKGKLRTYRQKRDFSKTREPRGASGATRRRGAARFVVHKHDATRLHFDLRLEAGGVYKSWAVPKGPSLDPHAKRLAVQVEDHPLEYGEFEGTIPEGEYGGGTVQLWDKGTVTFPDGTPEQGIDDGKLTFELAGKKLKGAWGLVRMRRASRGAKQNWLLVKKDDEFARTGAAAEIADEDSSVVSGRHMAEIAEQGSSRGGSAKGRKRQAAVKSPGAASKQRARSATSKTAAKNKKAAGRLRFVPAQLAKLEDRPPNGSEWLHEIKLDGYRIQVHVTDGTAIAYSRRGLDWTARFPEIAQACAKLPNCVLDGEVLAFNDRQEPDFSALQDALSRKKTSDLIYFVFDLLAHGDEDLRPRPLEERKEILQQLLGKGASKGSERLRYVEHFDKAGDTVLHSACRMDLEGIVSKRRDAPYRSGRWPQWIKTKCRGREEFVVGGITKDKNDKNVGALLVGLPTKDGLRYKGRVGTGFTRTISRDLLQRARNYRLDRSPFVGTQPVKTRDVIWLQPRLIAEVDYGGWTTDGLLRHAAYKGLREDKSVEEVGRDRQTGPMKPPLSATSRRTSRPARSNQSVKSDSGKSDKDTILQPRLTHPDKLLWAEEEIAKRDLADYYMAVAPKLMRFVGGRPISILRAPDGIDGAKFFQRHRAAGMSALIEDFTPSRREEPYLVINRPEALIALAQFGVVEIHPWGATTAAIEQPDVITFDFDPAEGVQFRDLKAAVLEARDRLADLDFPSYPKLTGGKGLHVVVPLVPSAEWPEVKSFARRFVEIMEKAAPDRFTTVARKSRRSGRIFLDYLRNERGGTAIAPWSPRGRPGAPLSVPINWAFLEGRRQMPVFTLDKLSAALKASDEWSDFEKNRRPLKHL